MNVVIDQARGELVIGRLLAAFRNLEYPYEETWALPQTFIPPAIKDDPLLMARFLFYCCHYMRGTIKSDLAVQRLISMWHARPDFFDPYKVAKLGSPTELADLLQQYIGYKVAEIAPFWIENSRRLVTLWQGDPRLIFADVTTPEEMYQRITNKKGRGFLGFQEKMASMLLYFLLHARLMPSLSASPPVDFHLLRIMIGTEVLIPETREERKLRYEHAEPKGRAFLEWYGKEHGVEAIDLGDALWMLSVVLCSQAPGNMSVGRKRDVTGKKIYPKPLEVSWKNPNHRKAYLASCGRCPIEAFCRWNVMSGDYYQTGSLNNRPRERPNGKDLFPLFGEGLPSHHRKAPKDAEPKMEIFIPRPAIEHFFGEVDLGKRPRRFVPNTSPEEPPE